MRASGRIRLSVAFVELDELSGNTESSSITITGPLIQRMSIRLRRKKH